jgi:uncharacterized membrane protein (Fun14 family)
VSEYEQVQTEYECSHCGCRAPAAVVIGSGERAMSNAAISLGLQPCPACGRRNTKLMALASVVPVLNGVLIAVLIGLVVSIVMFAAKVPGTLSLVGGGVLGIAAGVWTFRRVLHRDLAEASVPVIAIGDPIVEGTDPYRSPALRRFEPLPSPFTRERMTDAGYVIAVGAATLIAALTWGDALSLTKLLLAIGGGAIAGLVAGRDMRDRLFAIGTMSVIAVGVVLATYIYLADRSVIINKELLIPIAIGCLPGIALDRVRFRLTGRA